MKTFLLLTFSALLLAIFFQLGTSEVEQKLCLKGTMLPNIELREHSKYKFVEAGMQLYTHRKIPCEGWLSEWIFITQNKEIYNLHLAVFRFNISTSQYTMAGSTYINASTILQYEDKPLWINHLPDKPIHVEKGDILGVFYDKFQTRQKLLTIMNARSEIPSGGGGGAASEMISYFRRPNTFILPVGYSDFDSNDGISVDINTASYEYREPALTAIINGDDESQTVNTSVSTAEPSSETNFTSSTPMAINITVMEPKNVTLVPSMEPEEITITTLARILANESMSTVEIVNLTTIMSTTLVPIRTAGKVEAETTLRRRKTTRRIITTALKIKATTSGTGGSNNNDSSMVPPTARNSSNPPKTNESDISTTLQMNITASATTLMIVNQTERDTSSMAPTASMLQVTNESLATGTTLTTNATTVEELTTRPTIAQTTARTRTKITTPIYDVDFCPTNDSYVSTNSTRYIYAGPESFPSREAGLHIFEELEITCKGYLVEWNLLVGYEQTTIDNLTLAVFRPLNDKTAFEIVNETTLHNVTLSEDQRGRWLEYALPLDQQIPVEPGYFLGFYYDSFFTPSDLLTIRTSNVDVDRRYATWVFQVDRDLVDKLFFATQNRIIYRNSADKTYRTPALTAKLNMELRILPETTMSTTTTTEMTTLSTITTTELTSPKTSRPPARKPNTKPPIIAINIGQLTQPAYLNVISKGKTQCATSRNTATLATFWSMLHCQQFSGDNRKLCTDLDGMYSVCVDRFARCEILGAKIYGIYENANTCSDEIDSYQLSCLHIDSRGKKFCTTVNRNALSCYKDDSTCRLGVPDARLNRGKTKASNLLSVLRGIFMSRNEK